MSENCKIKLVFKSKEPEKLFRTISHKRKPSAPAYQTHSAQLSQGFERDTPGYALGLKAAIISQVKFEASPLKTFKNPKISESILVPSTPTEYEYCLTMEGGESRGWKPAGLQCEGRKASYSKEREKSPTGKFSRAISRQLSERVSRERRPSTSEYLSHKRAGYVSLERLERKKPFSMNPSHYEEVYMAKLKVLLDFYFKVQFATRLAADLSLSVPNPPRIRVYVGPGNNQFLVQQILKKRFWYEVVSEPKNCQLYWTQKDMSSIHEHQKQGVPSKKYVGDSMQGTNEEQNNLYRLFVSKRDEAAVQKLIDKQGYQFVYPQASTALVITNHIPSNHLFNERKHVLKMLQDYYEKAKGCDPWHVYPKTYLICNPSRADIHFYTFTVLQNKKKLWLIKPGERANDENEVELLPAAKIMEKLRKMLKDCDQPWSFLLQEYIERPFLYKGRKFDLHHFVLVGSIGGALRVYWYYQGYVRTSSKPFLLKDLNPLIHFTTDSVQAASPDYGRHEPANKLTYNDFERYLQAYDPYEPCSFQEQIIPQMKQIAIDLVLASYKQVDPQRRSNFELIGLDFMLDHSLKVYLTGVNTNPQMSTANPVMGKIVPSVIEQTLWLAVDPFLPPKSHFPPGDRLKLGTDPLNSLRFECIFDELEPR